MLNGSQVMQEAVVSAAHEDRHAYCKCSRAQCDKGMKVEDRVRADHRCDRHIGGISCWLFDVYGDTYRTSLARRS